jgi:hypothetical protein
MVDKKIGHGILCRFDPLMFPIGRQVQTPSSVLRLTRILDKWWEQHANISRTCVVQNAVYTCNYRHLKEPLFPHYRPTNTEWQAQLRRHNVNFKRVIKIATSDY